MSQIRGDSHNPLRSGLFSALILCNVYRKLLYKSVEASAWGMGLLYIVLVIEMAFRFKETGKILPAGLLFIVSLVTTDAYFYIGFMGGLD
ncbi:hypothetical protein GIB67_036446 [Kingdonia uniflora]|uniref:Uncharacterized protein n=1 Tax=Kingdonia uniflora TaxID=39325 RepID=A0A7J7L4A7_9MAGN|nr:hypothetical protein GIB67_036446 [Kingdonia uniflora]